jgi:glutathione S-transferase
MAVTIYVIPGSHPCRTGLLMLEHKGIPHRRVVLKPGFHVPAVRMLGFRGQTVPAVKLDGRRVQGTRQIARALDELQPEPRLLPDDEALRPAVEDAERFGEEVLQPAARRLVAAAGARDLGALRDHAASGRLGLLLNRSARGRRMALRLLVRRIGAGEEQEREDRERLPGWLDRIDGWIAQGALGGRDLNAADLQIATSLALIDYVLELRPLLATRPAGALMDRVLPDGAGPR